jgi:hypothetical protein
VPLAACRSGGLKSSDNDVGDEQARPDERKGGKEIHGEPARVQRYAKSGCDETENASGDRRPYRDRVAASRREPVLKTLPHASIIACAVGALTLEVVSCGSSPNTTATPSSIPTTTVPIVSTTDAISDTPLPPGRGIPAYTPPPPDAEGHPPCGMSAADWTAFTDQGAPHGTLIDIQKYPLVPSEAWTLPDSFTVVIQTTDGKHHTEDAVTRHGKFGPWDSVAEYDFIFRDIDPADVKRVLLTNSKGTCWVQPDSNS